MKKTIITACVFALTTTLAFAEPEGKQLAGLGFIGADANSDGVLSATEMQTMARDVFVSMDGDENESLSVQEFSSWGFGMRNLAEETGRVQAYDTALKIVYGLWDRDKNNAVSALEHRQAVGFDMLRADLNQDGQLTESEFLGSFIMNVALRAALKPAE